MIEYAYNQGLDIVTLFRIIVNNEEMYLNLPKKVWINTLEKAIEHFEICEDHKKYKQVINTERLLDKIAGYVMQSFFRAPLPVNTHRKKETQGDPKYAPFKSLTDADFVCFAMKNF